MIEPSSRFKKKPTMFARMQTFYYNKNVVVLQPIDLTNEKQPSIAAKSVMYTAYLYYYIYTKRIVE